MSEHAGQTPYEFARAFFSFLEARAVPTGECRGRLDPDLRVWRVAPVIAGVQGCLSCGLPADWPLVGRLTCASCGGRIQNGQAMIRSRSLVQVAFHPSCYLPAPVIPWQRQPNPAPPRGSEFLRSPALAGGRTEDAKRTAPAGGVSTDQGLGKHLARGITHE